MGLLKARGVTSMGTKHITKRSMSPSAGQPYASLQSAHYLSVKCQKYGIERIRKNGIEFFD